MYDCTDYPESEKPSYQQSISQNHAPSDTNQTNGFIQNLLPSINDNNHYQFYMNDEGAKNEGSSQIVKNLDQNRKRHLSENSSPRNILNNVSPERYNSGGISPPFSMDSSPPRCAVEDLNPSFLDPYEGDSSVTHEPFSQTSESPQYESNIQNDYSPTRNSPSQYSPSLNQQNSPLNSPIEQNPAPKQSQQPQVFIIQPVNVQKMKQ